MTRSIHRWLVAVLVLTLAVPAAVAREGELWYEMTIDGAKAGWMSDIVTDGDSTLITMNETMLRIARDGHQIEVTMKTTFVETQDGEPVELSFWSRMAARPVAQVWEFLDDHVLQTTKQGGRTTKTRLTLPEGVWLTPQAASRYGKERRAADVAEYSYRMLDPQSSGVTPVTVTSKRVGKGTFDTPDGRSVPVTIWDTVSSADPKLTITEHFSSDGLLLYMKIPTPGIGALEMRAVPRERAMKLGAGPELFNSTFVQLDGPIRNSMQLREAKLGLSVRAGTLPELPTAGAQRVEATDDDATAILVIDVDDPVPALDGDAHKTEYQAASTMIDSADPLIAKLASNAARSAGDDPRARAEAMRKRVRSHITGKGLQTAFASASETATSKAGDCSEHAVLLCAMLRADGIPSRVASGLVYVDRFGNQRHFFGWHMWTQALIDGVWVDLDATLPRTYHAAHVLTSTSSLADGAGDSDLASMLHLLGNLDIEVLEVGYD